MQIRRQDGSVFVLQPVLSERSPLEVRGVRSSLRRGELVALVREERERSGERVLGSRGVAARGRTAEALPVKRRSPAAKLPAELKRYPSAEP